MESSTTERSARIGIDEAGLGPILGPLVIGCVRFLVPSGMTLAKALPRARRKEGLRIDDSKKVYASQKTGLAALEHTVLAFDALLRGRVAEDAADLLSIAPDGESDGWRGIPWYRLEELELPMAAPRRRVERAAERLRERLLRAGVHFDGLHAHAVPEDRLNRQFDLLRNKARTELLEIAKLLVPFRDRPGRTFILVDRLGGRCRYSDELAGLFPMQPIACRAERRGHSEYDLGPEDRQITISFTVRGEEEHLEIALASMVAKYVREVFMEAFNRFWTGRRPGIRPTAGYIPDGRRFLRDLKGEPYFESIGRAALVRRL